jgi:rhamnose utilization protein RhaD (predicted bifunctional aldolase and dehydrogenase)/NAD(P)-dependent dehydrogenase (short-subunit alcohol dehydrogenase family)
MQDRWSDRDARAAIDRWGGSWGEALALRTYTSRLIGAEPDLVLHGGGNTSVEAPRRDPLGDAVPALLVKGSGWDLATIEPQGFTPVDLGYVRRLRGLEALTDEAMVEILRTRRLRSDAPDPSIETLLHAFLPHAFVDHSHADAILGLTNRRDGAARVREALGERVAIVPYVKAGFDLSKAAADAYDRHPDCVGMVLLHHGLFTFGATAEESYRRHVELVTAAERALAPQSMSVSVSVSLSGGADAPRAPEVATALRGALSAADPAKRRWILAFRPNPLAGDPDLADHVARGPLTPDHTIRTKPRGLVVDGIAEIPAALEAFAAEYEAYFERCAGADASAYVRLDPLPRVVWMRGLGLFTVGATAGAASIAADIAEHTVTLVKRASGLGPVAPLSDAELFEMEYWSLEQRKLGRGAEPLLARRVALVTGAGGAIGLGVVRQLLDAGAHVVATDISIEALERLVGVVGASSRLHTHPLDVTDAASVDSAFDAAAVAFGGVDLVVVNAGVAVPGRLEALTDEAMARALEVNAMGAMRTLRAAARTFGRQGAAVGGDVVVVSTKNVASPGAAFGAYSASKAAAHQLARVAALELAPLGVRVNLVAPDAVFAEGPVRSGLWAEVGPDRARSQGIDPDDPEALAAHYRSRNLLGAEVTGSHVGLAVVFLASGQVPVTGAVLPVDGGLPAAFSR